MNFLLLTLMLAQPWLEPDECLRTGERCRESRNGRPTGASLSLEFAPVAGTGMGTACACTPVFTAKGEAISFANSTVAECYSNDGQTLTQCGVNQPRVSSGTAASTVLGIWKEPVRNNLALHSRDLSQAVWTKTSMTCAKTATGMRNDANGASTCTASGANGTVIQAIVVAAATRNTSFHLKRRTGTGVVEVTRDNGATWTAVTASLSSTLWRRVVSEEVPGCAGGNCIVVAAMTSGIANPTVGLRLVTSGDAVDVDFVQDEETETASTPIVNAGVALSRDFDIIDLPVALSPTAATGLCVSSVGVTGGPYTAGGTAQQTVLTSGTLGTNFNGALYAWSYSSSATGIVAIDTAGVVSAGTATWGPLFSTPDTLSYKTGFYHTGALIRDCARDVCDVGSASTLGTPVFTRLLLGRATTAAANQFSGVIKQVMVDPSGRCWPVRTGPVAWVGDSIVYGNGSIPLDPPSRLTDLQPTRPVFNSGVGSNVIASCGARYNASIAGLYQTLIWSCGVNDMAAGTAGATAATAAQVFLADARARGMKVIVTGIMPWKNSAGWTIAKQTETVAYNSAMLTWAGANGAFYVPTIASMGGGGADPDVLLGAYDSGDLIHPNAAGSLQLATLVFAQTP